MFETPVEATLKCQRIEKSSKLAAAECITMQRKMVLEDKLEYAQTEAALQQKLCNIETANSKARIDNEREHRSK